MFEEELLLTADSGLADLSDTLTWARRSDRPHLRIGCRHLSRVQLKKGRASKFCIRPTPNSEGKLLIFFADPAQVEHEIMQDKCRDGRPKHVQVRQIQTTAPPRPDVQYIL